MNFLTILTLVLYVVGVGEAWFDFRTKLGLRGVGAFRRCLRFRGQSHHLVSRDLESDAAEYKRLNLQWNVRFKKVYPLAFFLPTTATDVSKAVKCGRNADIHLIPNSGGHSYESLGWGTNDTVIVDFRNMDKIRVEGSGPKAVGILEPGANVGHINAYLWENGGYAIAMGSCLPVAIGGHAIGGGLGYYGPLLGLAMDRVIEIEVIDANGEIVVASSSKNPDLFWALKGSGPGYIGIVTRFKVKLFEASKLRITLFNIHYKTKDFATGFMAFQKFQIWQTQNDPSGYLTLMATSDQGKYRGMPIGTLITAIHYQHPTEQPEDDKAFLKAIQDVFPFPARIVLKINPNHIQLVGLVSYAPVLLPDPATGKITMAGNFQTYLPKRDPENLKEEEILKYIKLATKDAAFPHYVKIKSFFVNKEFTLEQIEVLSEALQKLPELNVWLLYNADGGAIHRIPRNATAYVHRDAIADFNLIYEGSPEPNTVKEGMKILYEIWNAAQFMNSGETYQNYPDLDLKDSLEEHFKENFPRLVSEKRRWDPDNYFVSPLSIPVKPKQEL